MTSGYRVTLIDNDLNRHELACPGGPYLLGTNYGLAALPPVELRTERLAGVDGARLRAVGHGPSTLRVPVRINGDDDADIQTTYETLVRAIRPEGEFRLTAERLDGSTAREIRVRYEGGLENLAIPYGNYPTRLLNLDLVALDPWWTDIGTPVQTYGPVPFNDGGGGGINEARLNVTATVPVWPKIYLAGAMQNVEAVNWANNTGWRMVQVMDSESDEMIIETAPGLVGAHYNGSIRTYPFDAFTNLEDFALEPGENPIFIRAILGDTFGGGSFRFEWVNRYQTC